MAGGRGEARPRLVLALALGLIFAALALGRDAGAADPSFPPLTGRVVDQAQIISPNVARQIERWSADYERESRRQVVVATVKSLEGLPIEDYGYRLGRFWGIGERGRDTGVILLVAPNERTVRIEVGYGLEGVLTDAASRRIIESDILPAFRRGSYDDGIRAGMLSLLRTLGWTGGAEGAEGGGSVAYESNTKRDIAVLILFLLFVGFRFWLFEKRAASRRRRSANQLWGRRSHRDWPFGGGSFGGGGGGGGGSFGGGGGSFGGGGASGRW